MRFIKIDLTYSEAIEMANNLFMDSVRNTIRTCCFLLLWLIPIWFAIITMAFFMPAMQGRATLFALLIIAAFITGTVAILAVKVHDWITVRAITGSYSDVASLFKALNRCLSHKTLELKIFTKLFAGEMQCIDISDSNLSVVLSGEVHRLPITGMLSLEYNTLIWSKGVWSTDLNPNNKRFNFTLEEKSNMYTLDVVNMP